MVAMDRIINNKHMLANTHIYIMNAIIIILMSRAAPHETPSPGRLGPPRGRCGPLSFQNHICMIVFKTLIKVKRLYIKQTFQISTKKLGKKIQCLE